MNKIIVILGYILILGAVSVFIYVPFFLAPSSMPDRLLLLNYWQYYIVGVIGILAGASMVVGEKR
jgi:multisubunit Na+/H+ antiporter MnhF subunit